MSIDIRSAFFYGCSLIFMIRQSLKVKEVVGKDNNKMADEEGTVSVGLGLLTNIRLQFISDQSINQSIFV